MCPTGCSDRAIIAERRRGINLLDQAKAAHPTLAKTWVDASFKNRVIEYGATLGIDVGVVAMDRASRRRPCR